MEFDVSPPMVSCFDQWHRQVLVREHRWETHILDRHPELAGQYDAVEATIRAPELVTHDATYENRENFYRRGMMGGQYGGII